MSLDKLKEVLADNSEALEIVNGLDSTINELTKKVNYLETDSKKAFQVRDELKNKLNLVKNKFGLDEIDEDNLSKVNKKSDDVEVNNLKSMLEKINKEKEDIENSYKSKLSNFALKTELTKTGLAQKAINAEMYQMLESLALSGAVYDDSGAITYRNEDGSTMYKNGKPMSLNDRVAELEQSEAYKILFKPVGTGGTGATGRTGSGGNGGLKRSTMTNSDKAKFISEFGQDAYLKLEK